MALLTSVPDGPRGEFVLPFISSASGSESGEVWVPEWRHHLQGIEQEPPELNATATAGHFGHFVLVIIRQRKVFCIGRCSDSDHHEETGLLPNNESSENYG